MQTFIMVLIIIALAAALATVFNFCRVQRSAMSRVLHFLDAIVQGQYTRRIENTTTGVGGELERAANTLAAKLESRSAQSQQDSDHLISLLAILDHTNEIAIATDSSDNIRLVNPVAARVLGKPADQLLDRSIETVITNPELLALHKKAFHSNQPVSAQIAMQSLAADATAGRTLVCQATAATIYSGPHYRGTLLLLRDVTEVARTLQIKTDFVANASHELRTPLASIRAAVETIKSDDMPLGETSRRCIDIINSHALRLQMIITDLLDLSRAEDPRAIVRNDTLDLAAICDLVTGMYSTTAAEKHIQLAIELDENARLFRGDERLLTLTLKNLLDNAVKFTSAGSVTIRSYLMPADPTANGSSPRGIVLEVEDTGCGIPPEDQQRVFERFYTVNRSRGGADRGTGLGLAIVKHSVAAMGGIVTLLSEPNKGTTLRCSFPQRQVFEEPAAVA